MPPVEIINEKGWVIHHGKNLAVILRYNTGHLVRSVMVKQMHEGGARLNVEWEDGAYCSTYFCDFIVAQRFAARRRAFADKIKVVPLST
jgi:hypothetical protein